MSKKPADRIAKILRECAAKSSTFALKVHIVHGASTMKLQGYHVPGEQWKELPYAEMIEFPERAFHDACAEVGCDMAARPVKQPGFAYHWPMSVHHVSKLTHTPSTLHAEAVDRRNLDDSLDAIRVARQALQSVGL